MHIPRGHQQPCWCGGTPFRLRCVRRAAALGTGRRPPLSGCPSPKPGAKTPLSSFAAPPPPRNPRRLREVLGGRGLQAPQGRAFGFWRPRLAVAPSKGPEGCPEHNGEVRPAAHAATMVDFGPTGLPQGQSGQRVCRGPCALVGRCAMPQYLYPDHRQAGALPWSCDRRIGRSSPK